MIDTGWVSMDLWRRWFS